MERFMDDLLLEFPRAGHRPRNHSFGEPEPSVTFDIQHEFVIASIAPLDNISAAA
jgi:hypothetical protein